MKGYIYKYTYPNGKVYIGQTRVSVEARHKQHMWSYKNDIERRTLCEIAIAKYGEPIVETIETIEVDDDKPTLLCKKLDEAEMKWIHEYDSTDTQKGYNIIGGGQHKTPIDFILQEKWHEIFDKEKYIDTILYIENILNTIVDKNGIVGDNGEIIKFHLRGSDLTKEEKNVWYGIKFKGGWNNREMTFNSFVKTYPIPDYLDDIIINAFDDYKAYISKSIWDSIYKNKDRIIKEWYTNNK